MAQLRVSEAAELLGVSTDTMRRWAEAGKVRSERHNGQVTIDRVDLARFAAQQAHAPDPGRHGMASPRNRLKGIVTAITSDTVMSQVDIQAGPFRLVSLLSTEAVHDMGLQVGSIAVATVKATNVAVELGENRSV